jgi:uncharacterized protein (DUF2236 family)
LGLQELVRSDIVSEADLEHELETFRSARAGGSAGIFGPGSMTWRINRETAIFLAGGRALLLQLAHPWVAAAIAQHSQTLADPVGRFRRTFMPLFAMSFGTRDEAVSAARRLHRRHAEISGRLTENVGAFTAGSCYRANDVAALRWVHATLTDSALIAYELLCPPLSLEERERSYTEACKFASFFGIPQSVLPQSRAGFADYMETMLQSDVLVVSATARGVASAIFSAEATRLRIPFWYRALTLSLLPSRLRTEFGLSYGSAEQRAADRSLAILRYVYPIIPLHLRYVPPYHEALARLAGRSRPAPLTRVLNRFWIGQSSIAGGGG